MPEKNSSKNGRVIMIGLIIFMMVVIVGSWFTYASKGNKMEKAIQATYENNQNILGTCTNKILEIAQVPGMYRKDLIAVIKAEMEGRYNGEKGKVMNFIQERALNYDSKLYTQVQNEMSACSTRFELAQSKLIDQKKVYETALDDPWSGAWLNITGYPKIDLSEYKIVLAEDTAQIFKEGKRAPIKLPTD